MELVTNENYYQNTYSKFVGSTHDAIRLVCKNHMYSELYEIAALCNLLRCNIRSIYPKIDFRDEMAKWNDVFTPIPPVAANCSISILWSNALNEKDARQTHNGTWRANHFVPLLSPPIVNEHNNISQSSSIIVVSQLSVYVYN